MIWSSRKANWTGPVVEELRLFQNIYSISFPFLLKYKFSRRSCGTRSVLHAIRGFHCFFRMQIDPKNNWLPFATAPKAINGLFASCRKFLDSCMQHAFIFYAAGDDTFDYSAKNKSERRLQYCMQNKRIASLLMMFAPLGELFLFIKGPDEVSKSSYHPQSLYSLRPIHLYHFQADLICSATVP